MGDAVNRDANAVEVSLPDGSTKTHDEATGLDVEAGHLFVRLRPSSTEVVAVYAPGEWRHADTVHV